MPPSELKPGDVLTDDWLNSVRDLALGGRLAVGGGLAGTNGAGGSAVAVLRDPSCWVRVDALAAEATTGYALYDCTEQIPTPGGGWQNGVPIKAREANDRDDLDSLATPPIVWAQYDTATDSYIFTYGACS